MSGSHAFDTSMCCHDVMTTCRTELRPEDATVVEVHGSRFLLEWLDRETLAVAAALCHPVRDTGVLEETPAR